MIVSSALTSGLLMADIYKLNVVTEFLQLLYLSLEYLGCHKICIFFGLWGKNYTQSQLIN